MRKNWAYSTVAEIVSVIEHVEPDALHGDIERILNRRLLEMPLYLVEQLWKNVVKTNSATGSGASGMGEEGRPDLWQRAAELAMSSLGLPEQETHKADYERRQLSNNWFEESTGARLYNDLVVLSKGKARTRRILVCEVLITVPEGRGVEEAYATLWGRVLWPAGTSKIQRYHPGDFLQRFDENELTDAEWTILLRIRDELRRARVRRP